MSVAVDCLVKAVNSVYPDIEKETRELEEQIARIRAGAVSTYTDNVQYAVGAKDDKTNDCTRLFARSKVIPHDPHALVLDRMSAYACTDPYQ